MLLLTTSAAPMHRRAGLLQDNTICKLGRTASRWRDPDSEERLIPSHPVWQGQDQDQCLNICNWDNLCNGRARDWELFSCSG
jgi:hypothetical protein